MKILPLNILKEIKIVNFLVIIYQIWTLTIINQNFIINSIKQMSLIN